MLSFITESEVQKLWEIRCIAIKEFRNIKILFQYLFFMPIFSLIVWFVSRFDPTTSIWYLTVVLLAFGITSIVFICLSLTWKGKLFTESKEKTYVLLVTMFDSLGLVWVIFIFYYFGTTIFQFPSKMDIVSLITAGLIAIIFSTPILKMRIKNSDDNYLESAKHSFRAMTYVAIFSFLLSSLFLIIEHQEINIEVLFFSSLWLFVLFMLVLTTVFNVVSLFYFVKLWKIITMNK